MIKAEVLGQLLLMQSVVSSLPDEKSIFAFVCRGLLDLPGVAGVSYAAATREPGDTATVCIPLLVGEACRGELLFTVTDPEAFAPYVGYLKNFAFMLAVILEERRQRRQNELFQSELEARVQERTRQLREQVVERLSIERALRESEQYNRRLFETAVIGLALCRMDGSLVDVNAAYANIIGRTVAQTLGLSYWEITPEKYATREEKQLEALRSTGRYGPYEKEYIHKDGRRVPVRLQGLLIERGGEQFIWSSVEDVTGLKQAEMKLRRNEEVLRIYVEHSPAAIAMFDLDMKYIVASRRFLEDYGLGNQDLTGRHHYEVFPEMPERWKEIHRRCLAGAIERSDEDPFPRADGKVDWVKWEIRPWYEAQGEIGGIILFSEVITARKRAEEALQASQQLVEGILNAISVRVFWKDKNLVYLGCNAPFARDAGFHDPKDLLGKDDYQMAWRDQAELYRSDDRQVIESGRSRLLIEEPSTTAAGEIITLLTSKVPLRNSLGEISGVLGTYVDITEHRKLEEQLRQAQKLEGIGQLAGGIAHDFNNVLGAVIGFAGVLQTKIGEGDPLRHYVDEIVAAGERGADITRQILMFSRKQAFDLKPERLNGIVRGLEKMLRRLLPEPIDLAFDLSGEDPVILADKGQLVQVLLNLVTNARDAIVGNGRIGIATGRQVLDRSFVEAQGDGAPGEYAVLTVTDTGHGMDASTRARIFEPFFTTKELGKGTGLGLAVVHGIVKQHKGYINVYSEVGKGTVIRVYLPLAPAADAAGSPQAVPAQVTGGTETILVAEDDTALRKLTRTVLAQYGYTVIEAEDGMDAVAKFTANQEAIRVVLLDGLMPKMGGVEALAQIRRICPGVKALFMSGYDDKIFSGGAYLDKTTAFIQKPVMIDDLLRTVRELLDGSAGVGRACSGAQGA